MARPIRLDAPGTFYHVMSRGNERRDIFRDRQDYLKFIDTLKRLHERFGLEIHAYVLMKNHYHLLVRTVEANLSRSIQWLGLTYTRWFNWRHNRSGHLFQGRFKSFVIENDRYFAAMCLYIHRNPVRAGVVNNIEMFKWSSYNAYAGFKKTEPWLTTDIVLGVYNGDRRGLVQSQAAYNEKEAKTLDGLKLGLFMGDPGFVEKWRGKLIKERHREKPQIRAVLRGKNIKDVLFRVLKELKVDDVDRLLRPIRCEKRSDRDMAIYSLVRMGIYTHREIGEMFNVGYTSVSNSVVRAEDYLQKHKKMKRRIENIIIK